MNAKVDEKNKEFEARGKDRRVPKENYKFPKQGNLDYVMLDILDSK